MLSGLRPLPPPSPHPSSARGTEGQRTRPPFARWPLGSQPRKPSFSDCLFPRALTALSRASQGHLPSPPQRPPPRVRPLPPPCIASPAGGNRTPSPAPCPPSLSLGQRGVTRRPAWSFSRRGGAWGAWPLLPGRSIRSGAPGAQPAAARRPCPPPAAQPRLPPLLRGRGLQHPSLPACSTLPACQVGRPRGLAGSSMPGSVVRARSACLKGNGAPLGTARALRLRRERRRGRSAVPPCHEGPRAPPAARRPPCLPAQDMTAPSLPL